MSQANCPIWRISFYSPPLDRLVFQELLRRTNIAFPPRIVAQSTAYVSAEFVRVSLGCLCPTAGQRNALMSFSLMCHPVWVAFVHASGDACRVGHGPCRFHGGALADKPRSHQTIPTLIKANCQHTVSSAQLPDHLLLQGVADARCACTKSQHASCSIQWGFAPNSRCILATLFRSSTTSGPILPQLNFMSVLQSVHAGLLCEQQWLVLNHSASRPVAHFCLRQTPWSPMSAGCA